MKSLIDIKTLEFDVSNKCGNTCQWCYHNKIITEVSTRPEDFEIYLDRFFNINISKSLESFALYGGNILENKNLPHYLRTLSQYDKNIQEYVFSTTFGTYDTLAQINQKILLSDFFSDKKFIFQYFFNPEFTQEYILSCKDLLSYNYQTHIFFSVQLVEVEREYIISVIKSVRRFFIAIGCTDISQIEGIEKNIFRAILWKTRIENFEIKVRSYTFLVMVLFPVRKIRKTITSVCGDSCSFYSSSFISDTDIYNSSMLSIEYDGSINFHNPNCIASLQKICNITDDASDIEKKLKNFYKFLEQNIHSHPSLIDSCNVCLWYNLQNSKKT